jgi:hypothetical protein
LASASLGSDFGDVRNGDRRLFRDFGAGEVVAGFPVGEFFGIGAALGGEFHRRGLAARGVMIPSQRR